jgi:hypothetical protein
MTTYSTFTPNIEHYNYNPIFVTDTKYRINAFNYQTTAFYVSFLDLILSFGYIYNGWIYSIASVCIFIGFIGIVLYELKIIAMYALYLMVSITFRLLLSCYFYNNLTFVILSVLTIILNIYLFILVVKLINNLDKLTKIERKQYISLEWTPDKLSCILI